MNTNQATAFRALRAYYMEHDRARREDPAGLSVPCPCDACEHTRWFAQQVGVNLVLAAALEVDP